MTPAQMAFEKRKARLAREKTEKCWTCGKKGRLHSTYRDALGEYELTCDDCHRNEYPEEYEEREGEYDWMPEGESETCARCEKTFRYYLHDATCDDCSSYFVCKDCEMLMEGCGICGK